MSALLYLLFFCSGISGLIYQVVWVRVFGNVFGNTVHSAALVVAVFMLGLGAGGYLIGAWADRRYARQPESLLRAYAYVEMLIGALALGVSAILPHLDRLVAMLTAYSYESSGWYVVSTPSYLARAAIAVVLLIPITLLMGGTLTLLIRHVVRSDLAIGGWRIGVIYAVNTAGAALGCFLTDFAFVPSMGLQRTQFVAGILNIVVGLGALWLASRPHPAPRQEPRTKKKRAARAAAATRAGAAVVLADAGRQQIVLTYSALAIAGFAAMGMEILWFRHVSILLGGFRAVFSLLLTVILAGIVVGSLAGAALLRRTARPAEWLMAVQGLFVASALLGLAAADARPIEAASAFDPAVRGAIGFAGAATGTAGFQRALIELWFNAKPILFEVGIPALLMGFSFPLANAIIQRVESVVGSRAGALYLANTLGAVCGSLAAGFVLLPALGIQRGATVLAIVAALSIVPLFVELRNSTLKTQHSKRAFAFSLATACVAIAVWLTLPSDYVNTRAIQLASRNERLLTMSEGLTELIAVTDVPGEGRRLLTNGHSMSATTRLSQRYMRALAHIPLLSLESPESVLVIGFGVGNTTHAATLHPSIRRVEVADLSKDILAHAGEFSDVNQGVLGDSRVMVFVNDGRQHLQLVPRGAYDLIALEPPPIAYAGVAALYSPEFYALARSRLAPGGYVSQWLPAYQVPTSTTLSMIRAFVDVFPQTVLVSGAEADLLLFGINGDRLEIDPDRVAAALARAPAVRADLQRLDLGEVREIVGTFLGSPATLAGATRAFAPVTDDRPIQEYDVRSLLNLGEAVPSSIVELGEISSWCPRCFVDGVPTPVVDGLDTYLALLGLAYSASPSELARVRSLPNARQRTVAGSWYLGAIVPETPDRHNIVGISRAARGDLTAAIVEFRAALTLDPDSSATHWHLGAALASTGARAEAVQHLRRAVELDPGNRDAQNDLTAVLGRARGSP
jgi:spermidine synthase